MKYLIFSFLTVLAIASCNNETINREAAKAEINRVLDDWHNAAAEGDFERYFNHFAGDSAIFMGTDASEYWTIAEFKPWAKPYFEDDMACSYAPVQRHIYISESGRFAWFVASLANPGLGTVRGSGVLVKADTTWKIAHYNLSIPIPNSIADTVVAQIEEALADTLEK